MIELNWDMENVQLEKRQKTMKIETKRKAFNEKIRKNSTNKILKEYLRKVEKNERINSNGRQSERNVFKEYNAQDRKKLRKKRVQIMCKLIERDI